MKHTKQILAMLLALSMCASLAFIPTAAFADEAEPAANLAYPITDLEVPGENAKWTEEVTEDGWIRVTQDGGETLGYSPDSGVSLLQHDGYAFKDLNQNGVLDQYEDWRLDDATRVEGLLDLMSVEDMAALRVSPLSMSTGDPNADTMTMGEEPEDTLAAYVARGIRFSDNMGFIMKISLGTISSKIEYSNALQAVSESSFYGLPYVIACDPSSMLMGYANQKMQASTFDTETVNAFWQVVSKGLRAIGVTMMLGPQVDLETDPRTLGATVWSEDPLLASEMTAAAIDGMQSTYDEDGNDIGWGYDSVVSQTKHFVANNSIEGGRSYHGASGKYSVFPGGQFETQLAPFVDGAFNLDGLTEQTGAIMVSYSIPWDDDNSLGGKITCDLNEEILGLAREAGFDGLIATDAIGIEQYDYNGAFAGITATEEAAMMYEAGVDQILSSSWSITNAVEAYDILVDDLGEEAAYLNYRDAARRAAIIMFETQLIDNPYLVVKDSVAYLKSTDQIDQTVNTISQESIVMLKNSNNTISAASEKQTVYIPMVSKTTTSMVQTEAGCGMVSTTEWVLPVNEALANQYFNVITDTVDEEGNITRAIDSEGFACDRIITFITNPDTGSGTSGDTYVPISLQYGEYTANSIEVRQESISGDAIVSYAQTPYGVITSEDKENRSYYGQSTVAANLSDMELVQEMAAKKSADTELIVCINSSGAMIFSEIEPYADAILMMFGRNMMGGSSMGAFTDASCDNFLALVAGEIEPNALLAIQMPANMETVEAQCEDVPRDMECYVDADGNTYDFAFGMNWSGVIQDGRTEKYAVEPQVGTVH